MFSINFIIGVGLVFILVLLGVLFLIPSEQKILKKKKQQQEKDLGDQLKESQQAVSRLEKHTQSLRAQVAQLQKKEIDQDKQLLIEQAKNKKLQEKVLQEKQWLEKEEQSIDKKAKEIDHLKKDIDKLQDQFTKEHALALKLNREIEDLKKQLELQTNQRRTAELETKQLATKYDDARKEIANLKGENIQLAKKNEDVNWIAKSEYERISKLLKEKEKEFERLQREIKG